MANTELKAYIGLLKMIACQNVILNTEERKLSWQICISCSKKVILLLKTWHKKFRSLSKNVLITHQYFQLHETCVPIAIMIFRELIMEEYERTEWWVSKFTISFFLFKGGNWSSADCSSELSVLCELSWTDVLSLTQTQDNVVKGRSG